MVLYAHSDFVLKPEDGRRSTLSMIGVRRDTERERERERKRDIEKERERESEMSRCL